MSVKNELIEILESHKGKILSISELAKYTDSFFLDIPLKIRELRKEGYKIVTHGMGYTLDIESDIISKEAIKIYLDELKDKFHIKVFKEIDSTNNYAKKIALKKSSHKTVVVADSQTDGKGRCGRKFYSPQGNGIYMSLILKPAEIPCDVTLITVAAASAVSLTLEKMFNLKPQIKWVNDIFLSGKKVCGILAEAVGDFKNGKPDAVVLGIGINIKSTEFFPVELKEIAGALGINYAVRNKLIAGILKELDNYTELHNCKNALPYYREKSMVIGKTISYEKNGETLKGKAIEINDSGNLVVEDEFKKRTVINSGEIRIGLNDIC